MDTNWLPAPPYTGFTFYLAPEDDPLQNGNEQIIKGLFSRKNGDEYVFNAAFDWGVQPIHFYVIREFFVTPRHTLRVVNHHRSGWAPENLLPLPTEFPFSRVDINSPLFPSYGNVQPNRFVAGRMYKFTFIFNTSIKGQYTGDIEEIGNHNGIQLQRLIFATGTIIVNHPWLKLDTLIDPGGRFVVSNCRRRRGEWIYDGWKVRSLPLLNDPGQSLKSVPISRERQREISAEAVFDRAADTEEVGMVEEVGSAMETYVPAGPRLNPPLLQRIRSFRQRYNKNTGFYGGKKKKMRTNKRRRKQHKTHSRGF